MNIMLETLWAMEPVRLEAFLREVKKQAMPDAVLDRQARANGSGGNAEHKPYDMAGPVAIVPLSGPLTKNGGWWGTSMRDTGAALRQAAKDPSVRAIMLDVDSPGGTVNGTEELAATVRAVNAVKPVYTYAADLMCSAAYWIGSQAREIASQASADIGSIGVVTLHADWSKALDDFGLKLTYLTAGKYKAMGNQAEPLSDEARAYIQTGLDGVYSLFLEAVAQGRGVDADKDPAKLSGMADGKVFLARQALDAGLIDRIESREAFINHITQEVHMDLKTLKEQHASVLAEHKAEVMAAASAAHAEELATAVTGEQARCLGVMIALVGDEVGAQVAELVKTGVSAEQAAVMGKFMRPAANAQNASQAMLDALAGVTARPLNTGSDVQAGELDFDALVKIETAKGTSRAQAMAKVAKENPKAHAAWKAGLKPKEGE